MSKSKIMLNCTYIAKPSLFNNNGKKEFDNPKDAVDYLNKKLLPNDGDHERYNYVFVAPSSSKSNLKHAIEEYTGIGKLIIMEN